MCPRPAQIVKSTAHGAGHRARSAGANDVPVLKNISLRNFFQMMEMATAQLRKPPFLRVVLNLSTRPVQDQRRGCTTRLPSDCCLAQERGKCPQQPSSSSEESGRVDRAFGRKMVLLLSFMEEFAQVNLITCYLDFPTSAVMAAASIANIVRSSLGPVGLDKMLVDDIGVRPTPLR